MRGRRVLVVDWQLDEITNAVEGASVLFECLRTNQLADEKQEAAAERAALSVLDLTVAHLRQLIRALRHQVDAADLMTRSNSTPPSSMLREQHAVILLPGGGPREAAAPKRTAAKKRSA